MTDRTVDVWGPRTPTARGAAWAERVDLHLDGVGEDEVDRWVSSACVLCSNGCGCEIAVKDGRMVGIRGRVDDRVNHGRLGPKGLYGSTPWASSPDRLTRPLVREGGRLVETDWDTAMGRVVERSRALLDEKGPLSHGFYTSGQLFLEEYYTLAVIGKAGLGTPHMDGNTRLCTATAARRSRSRSAPTGSRRRTTTSSCATRCSSTGTTCRRHRPSCGRGCSTGSRATTRRWSSASTRAAPRSPWRPSAPAAST